MTPRQLRIQVVEQKIILEPLVTTSPIDALYGRFAGYDLLGDLEREHQREIENEGAIRSLVSGDPELDQLHGRIEIEKLRRDE